MRTQLSPQPALRAWKGLPGSSRTAAALQGSDQGSGTPKAPTFGVSIDTPEGEEERQPQQRLKQQEAKGQGEGVGERRGRFIPCGTQSWEDVGELEIHW